MTGLNGEPVATRARPSVHLRMSEGSASALRVGFDSGMITGRSQWADIVLTISSVKAPVWAEQPMRIVGWTLRTTSLNVYWSGASVVHPSSEGLLEVTQPQTVPQQTPGSQSPEVGTRSFLVQALANHELYQEIRDAGAS